MRLCLPECLECQERVVVQGDSGLPGHRYVKVPRGISVLCMKSITLTAPFPKEVSQERGAQMG